MLDNDEYNRWHQAAEHNLTDARVLADAGSHHSACFHAEMAAQLMIKGLLHGIGAGDKGHDLVGLGRALADAIGGELPEDLQAGLRGLSRHYIASRYPDAYPVGTPGEHYGAEDAGTAIAQAKDVVDFVSSWWRQLTKMTDEEAE
ncbi:MAG: HEPN domain-containing protein [Egibacteraceae bacterium]